MIGHGTSEILLALAVTLIAGLATGIGSAIAFFARTTNYRFLSVSLGFSAGVMIYISFVEILRKAIDSLVDAHGGATGEWIATGSFFAGMIIMGLIDRMVPAAENPHEIRTAGDLDRIRARREIVASGTGEPAPSSTRLLRMGVFTAMAIAIHNFPEGMATFFASISDLHLGIATGIALGLHNIPEGISVSVPIYFATGNRSRAFLLSFLSGLAEVLGGILGVILLGFVASPSLLGIVFAIVAGFMVYVSLDELLPTAREYGKSHEVLAGILLGMAVMATSLLLLR
ncbi:MAG: zinc transporter ZupT [Candidatus Eisenbacteria bacterium]|nr:zinc transporter ZupT [Candidatus Eisenbacteria bacterium]